MAPMLICPSEFESSVTPRGQPNLDFYAFFGNCRAFDGSTVPAMNSVRLWSGVPVRLGRGHPLFPLDLALLP